MSRQKVLIIGLDGFTWRVGNRLVQENYMPTLGRLMKNGCHGTLTSVIPYETSPAWSSFQTGCYPEKTGVFAFHRYDAKTRQITLNNCRDIGVPTLWELLSMGGKKVVSINMPMTSPPPCVNGVMIPGLTCPGLSRETVYPPEIYDQYLKSNPDYLIVNNDHQKTIDDYVCQAIGTEEVRCRLALQLMQEIDWDVFSVQIQSTDAFQHKNWWALDPEAAGYMETAYLKAVKFYQSIDGVIGRLLEAAGESVLTVVASDHGFCSKRAEIGINTWLSQNGYLHLNTERNRPSFQAAKDKLKRSIPLLKYLTGVCGKTFQIIFHRFGSVKTNDTRNRGAGLYSEKVVGHIRETIDLDRTFAFCLGGMAGSLYLVDKRQKNKAGEMIEKLLKAYGPDSPEPLIAGIQAIENKNAASSVPDYMITFSPGVEARISPGGVSVTKSGILDEKQTGTHEQDGVFVFHGPGVNAGHNFNANIIDVIPTLLSCLSVPVLDYMDGKVLHAAFTDRLEVKYQTVKNAEKEGTAYSDTDQSTVEKQLKDLGYL
jgi:predicted AlkP superfamily phosphohydrolase/phosphomutase